MRRNSWWKKAPSSFHHFLFQLCFKDVFHHDKQADGSVAPTGHSPFIFLINKVEEKFQIEPLRSFLHLLPVSDIPQRRIVDAAVEPCQFAVRIAQLDDGFIGNAQSRKLMFFSAMIPDRFAREAVDSRWPSSITLWGSPPPLRLNKMGWTYKNEKAPETSLQLISRANLLVFFLTLALLK